MSDQTLCAREGCGWPESDTIHYLKSVEPDAHAFEPPVVPPLSGSGTRNLTREERAEFDAKHYDHLPDIAAASDSAPEPERVPHGHITFAYDEASGDLIATPERDRTPPAPPRCFRCAKDLLPIGKNWYCGDEACPARNYVLFTTSAPAPTHCANCKTWYDEVDKLAPEVGILRHQLATERAAHEATLAENERLRECVQRSASEAAKYYDATTQILKLVTPMFARASLPSSSTVSNQ